MIAYEYGPGSVFLMILWIFMFVIWFWLLISIFGDLFRDHELSGWAKAGWVILVIILPLLGILIYLIARGKGMQERAVAAQQEAEAQFQEYVRQTAGPGGSAADQLAKLSELHDKGTIDDEEFAKLKSEIVSG